MMPDEPPKTSRSFLLGNVVLAAALLVLLLMGTLWELMGVLAMVLWVLLVGVGIYLLFNDKGRPPAPP